MADFFKKQLKLFLWTLIISSFLLGCTTVRPVDPTSKKKQEQKKAKKTNPGQNKGNQTKSKEQNKEETSAQAKKTFVTFFLEKANQQINDKPPLPRGDENNTEIPQHKIKLLSFGNSNDIPKTKNVSVFATYNPAAISIENDPDKGFMTVDRFFWDPFEKKGYLMIGTADVNYENYIQSNKFSYEITKPGKKQNNVSRLKVTRNKFEVRPQSKGQFSFTLHRNIKHKTPGKYFFYIGYDKSLKKPKGSLLTTKEYCFATFILPSKKVNFRKMYISLSTNP